MIVLFDFKRLNKEFILLERVDSPILVLFNPLMTIHPFLISSMTLKFWRRIKLITALVLSNTSHL